MNLYDMTPALLRSYMVDGPPAHEVGSIVRALDRQVEGALKSQPSSVPVWGDTPELGAMVQLFQIAQHPATAAMAMMADNHQGYGYPIGSVVAWRQEVDPKAVGFDIGCGNEAVLTPLTIADVSHDALVMLADEITRRISFGVGRRNAETVEHPIFDDYAWRAVPAIAHLKELARQQLGTVGAGNHYVDVLVDEDERIWVANHFGSRGLGHKIASGFMNLAAGREWGDKTAEDAFGLPVLLDLRTYLGDDYWMAMVLASQYALAGRQWVTDQVLGILGVQALYRLNVNHNQAWHEWHHGEVMTVARKGATRLNPGEFGYIGGSMGAGAVIVEGLDTPETRLALTSAPHGAGRRLSRTRAAGKVDYKGRFGPRGRRVGGEISQEMMDDATRGVIVRGGGRDEAPQVYKDLDTVMAHHADTLRVVQRLQPLIVVMAPEAEVDPYKD